MKINTTFLVFIHCLLLEKSEQTRTNKYYIQDLFKIIQSCITKITFHKMKHFINIMYQNKPNLSFICCYINSCSSINISSKNSNVCVVVNFSSQVIFIFLLFQLHIKHTLSYPKRKGKQNLPDRKKINYNMSLGQWAMIKKGRRNRKKESACPHAFFFFGEKSRQETFFVKTLFYLTSRYLLSGTVYTIKD